MIELLALVSAVFYGSADFFGGMTARRANTVATVFVSQFAGLVLLLVALPFLPAANPSSRDWIWGVIAGLSGGIGVALLYRALAVGIMAVVAPITAVCAAMIPVIAAFANGERLRLTAMAGIALAFAAIAMVSQSPSDSGRKSRNEIPILDQPDAGLARRRDHRPVLSFAGRRLPLMRVCGR